MHKNKLYTIENSGSNNKCGHKYIRVHSFLRTTLILTIYQYILRCIPISTISVHYIPNALLYVFPLHTQYRCWNSHLRWSIILSGLLELCWYCELLEKMEHTSTRVVCETLINWLWILFLIWKDYNIILIILCIRSATWTTHKLRIRRIPFVLLPGDDGTGSYHFHYQNNRIAAKIRQYTDVVKPNEFTINADITIL